MGKSCCACGIHSSLCPWVFAAIVYALVWNWSLLQQFGPAQISVDPFDIPERRGNASRSDTYHNHTIHPTASPSYYWNCTPSHHACDDYRGILHIESGDFGGAGGTIFFQFVIAQLIYADQNNLLPFIHLDNFSHLVYDDKVHGANGYRSTCQVLGVAQVESLRDPRMYHAIYPGPPILSSLQSQQQPEKEDVMNYPLLGTGVWNHYFLPVSDFCPGDLSCRAKPLVKLERAHVSPGLHLYAPWSPKIWRYLVLPDHIGQPHIPLTEWLMPQRRTASAIVNQYYQFQSSISSRINPSITRDCLGLHVRWSDKGISRRKLGLVEFLPLVQAYVQARDATNTRVCIYLATDAQQVVQQVQSTWPEPIVSRLILSGATIRSPNETAVFDMDSHHLTNLEVLRDILELSQCGFLLHGNSAVSESAIYLNSDLILQSVNLEDPDHPLQDPQVFEKLVVDVSTGSTEPKDLWNRYGPQPQWWQQTIDPPTVSVSPAYNNTLRLTPNWKVDDFMAINRWVTLVFLKFWQLLAETNEVAVDPVWTTWFACQDKTNPCMFQFSRLELGLQTTTSSLAKEPFFKKRFKSIAQEENAGFHIRQQMHRVLNTFYLPRPHLLQRADTTFPSDVYNHSLCLGVHIPDPGYKRKNGSWVPNKYPDTLYQQYITAYHDAGGSCVYLATDSYTIWEKFSSLYSNVISLFTQADAVRNRNQVPSHYMEESIQRLGSEALVDIWNLQRCGWFLHGYSQISEVVLFWNPTLKSIFMPDRHGLQNFSDHVHSMFH